MKQAIILSAGKGTRIKLVSENNPKMMVFVGGIPLVYRTIMLCIRHKIKKIIIVIQPRDLELIKSELNTFFQYFDLEIVFVLQKESKGPGHALAIASNYLSDGSVLTFLGDTLLDENLPILGDWVGVSETNDKGSWCWIESNDKGLIKKIWDKVLPPNFVKNIACGCYFFSDSNLLKEISKKVLYYPKYINNEIQISYLLEEYNLVKPISVFSIKTWKDFGNISNYISNFRNSFGYNKFNNFSLDEFGYIRKKSHNIKIIDEINWFLSLDLDQKKLTPQIINYDFKNLKYDIEYLDLPTFSQIFYFSNLDLNTLSEIFSLMLSQFQKYLWKDSKSVNLEDQIDSCLDMYINKTKIRLNSWFDSNKYIFIKPIILNGINLGFATELIDFLFEKLKEFSNLPKWKFIHGDLNFGNILFSRKNCHFRLIDPRGKFSNFDSLYGGDVRYELAKIRHSYHGKFEFFANDLFLLDFLENGSYKLSLPYSDLNIVNEFDKIITDFGFNIKEIMFIEASLFISMVDLHKNSSNRDLALFLHGLNIIKNLKDSL